MGTVELDISEAEFSDEHGKKVEKPNLSYFMTDIRDKGDNKIQINLTDSSKLFRFGSITPGQRKSGSGYTNLTGFKISKYDSGVDTSFKADFTLVYRSGDILNRIYDVRVNGTSTKEVTSVIRQGVFNSVEKINLPAYGGVQFLSKPSTGGYTETHHVYLQVSNDSYSIVLSEP